MERLQIATRAPYLDRLDRVVQGVLDAITREPDLAPDGVTAAGNRIAREHVVGEANGVVPVSPPVMLAHAEHFGPSDRRAVAEPGRVLMRLGEEREGAAEPAEIEERDREIARDLSRPRGAHLARGRKRALRILEAAEIAELDSRLPDQPEGADEPLV